MADFEINIKVNGVEQTVKTISQLETAIQQTQAELSGLEVGSREFKSLENQSRNLENIFNALNEDVAGFTKNVSKSASATQKMASAIQDTAEATQNLSAEPIREVAQETEKFTSKASSARAELRKITQELYNLEPGSERFEELSLRAGQLRDQMGDTSAIISSVAGNAAERFGGSLELALTQGIIGLQGLQQGFQAAGIENEKLNKTIGVLQGVLGAASLIKFAGSLPDTIDQIKAGFASTIAPAKAYIVSLFATTAATEGATIATRALAVAQKALPLLAIAATIAAVGYALFDYFSATEKTTQSVEELRKQEEAAAKARKEENIRIGETAIGFLDLVFQLKNTNAGTKERIKLIKEINQEYGTTFKNLKDETKFQDQLNLSVKEYIALKVLQQRQAKKAEQEAEAIGKLIKAQDELTKIQETYAGKSEKEIADYDQKKFGVSVYSDALNRAKGNLEAAQAAAEEFAISNDDLRKEMEKLSKNGLVPLTEATGKNTSSTKNNTDEVNKQKEAYNQLQQKLLEWNKQVGDSEKALEESRRTQDRSEVERQSIALDLSLANIITKYETDRKFIDENIKDKIKANEAIAKLEKAKSTLTINLATATLNEIKKLNQQQVQQDEFLIQQLKLGREILNKEFTFGNQNTNDLILSQQNEFFKTELALVEKQLEDTSKLELKKQNELVEARIALREMLAKNELEISKQTTNTELVLQRTEILKYYDDLKQIQVEFNKETGELQVKFDQEGFNQRLKDIEQEVDKEAKIREEAGDKTFDVATELQKRSIEERNRFNQVVIQAEEFLQSQIQNLNIEANLKLEAAEVEFAQKRVGIAEKTGEEIKKGTLENVVAFVEEINQIASQSFDVISNLFNEIDNIRQTDQELRNQENQRELDALRQRYETEKQLETDRYQKGLITKEAYNQSVLALDNQLSSASENLNNQLVAQQNEVAEKTFKTQKALRISNTIISGIQGAIDAYTSAQSLPFGAGAIVGPILAAAVAATTAIAVRNIAKTKFSPQGGGGSGTSVSFSSQSANIPQIGGGGVGGQSGGFTSFNTQNIGTPGQQTQQTEDNNTSQSEQRVYVVESDITQTQRRVRVLEGQSTFN